MSCRAFPPPIPQNARQARAAMAAVLVQLPELTYFGLGVYDARSLSPAAYAQALRAKQAELLAETATFTAVCRWLASIAPRETMSYGSYHVKHIAENVIGQYVANGTLIAAAVHCGFPYQCIPHSPNVRLGLSRRSLYGAMRSRRAVQTF